jgi:hypothetical protein
MRKILSIIIFILVAVLIFGSGFYAGKYFYQPDKNILIFEKLFIEKVLETKGAVGYEDRLNLETAVQNTKDSQIQDKWQVLLNSATEVEAQQNTFDLLKLIAEKLSN